jgi:ribonuclease HII
MTAQMTAKPQPSKPDFSLERVAMARGISPIAGVDEAGRGPLAGPVVAAAVILDPGGIPAGLDDSKKLRPAQREHLFMMLQNTAEISVAIADVERIDADNILQATLWAMAKAVHKLEQSPDLALVDGNQEPELNCFCKTLVKGDTLSLSIAAASIAAKVVRDKIMDELAEEFPGYGWERNRGYGTREHVEALEKLGPTPFHRRSFAPVRRLLK